MKIENIEFQNINFNQLDKLENLVNYPSENNENNSKIPGFLEVFENSVVFVDNQTQNATNKMQAVDSGKSDDLAGAILESQQANLSFSLLSQVRNKIMSALDDIVRLQV